MAEAFQSRQVARFCSSAETIQKAQSILRVVTAKTRPGSGFVVNPVALPAICAYLASEQLNTGEVSLQTAINAACISKSDFSDSLKTVRAALRDGDDEHITGVTYETLVDAYRVHPREQAVACMEDTEGAFSQVDILKEKHGVSVVICAIFFWVCQLMEEPVVQERSLCQMYRLPPKAFKSMLTTLDKHCDFIANQIKSCLLQQPACAESSTIPHQQPITRLTTSTPRSPVKSAMKSRPPKKDLPTPMTTPSNKRTVVFPHLPPEGDIGDRDGNFPETPTKKRKIDHSSPSKRRVSVSPAKPPPDALAAFHAAMKGSPAKRSAGNEGGESLPLEAGPSTPRRPRFPKPIDVSLTPTQSNAQTSPSRSQGQLTQSAVRRRFRPVFLEQQQWCDRDPKVERIWADAESNKLTWTSVPMVSAK